MGEIYYQDKYPGVTAHDLVLYHLLTDKGYFKIENIKVLDYNSLIDHYLEI